MYYLHSRLSLPSGNLSVEQGCLAAIVHGMMENGTFALEQVSLESGSSGLKSVYDTVHVRRFCHAHLAVLAGSIAIMASQ